MSFINTILCWVESIVGSIFGFLNRVLNLDLAVPDLGCDD
jgi:hypothetical protein